jgi:hypothetical protein
MISRTERSERQRHVIATTHRLVDQYSSRIRRFVRDPQPMIDRYIGRRFPRRQRPADRPPGETIAPAVALRENGFTVARALIPAEECARIAAALKRETGIRQGKEYTCVDATRRIHGTRQLLADERILGAVRAAIGPDIRFLQTSDLHYHHDTSNWHRDNVHRAADNRQAPDWVDTTQPYHVVKAIVYLESHNAAMGMMCGSHARSTEIDQGAVYWMERKGWHKLIGADDEPNRRFTPNERSVPFVWTAGVGDVLIFDERMYHCGRRVESGRVIRRRSAPKFTLSMVFGADNVHSARMYSYFRFIRRELGYRNLPKDLRLELKQRGLVLSSGWRNYYADHPEELRLVHLRNPADMDELIASFRR